MLVSFGLPPFSFLILLPHLLKVWIAHSCHHPPLLPFTVPSGRLLSRNLSFVAPPFIDGFLSIQFFRPSQSGHWAFLFFPEVSGGLAYLAFILTRPYFPTITSSADVTLFVLPFFCGPPPLLERIIHPHSFIHESFYFRPTSGSNTDQFFCSIWQFSYYVFVCCL